jgi:hypothetical protein
MKSSARPPRLHTASLLQALLSALGLSACAVGAGFMAVSGVLVARSGNTFAAGQADVLISLAWSLAFLAVVGLPSLFFASQRIAGRAVAGNQHIFSLRTANIALLLWPLVLAAGRALSGDNELALLLLPPLQILAVVLPLWWLVAVALEKLPRLTPQRAWGVVNFALFFSTPLVIVVEMVLFLVLLSGLVLVVSGRPELQQQFELLSQRLLTSISNPEALLRIYGPLLAQPWVIFGLLAGLSGVVPLVEELIKPMAVWALAGRKLTPAEGFSAGALAGAGFAVLETLFSLANPVGNGWVALTVGRAGTGLLHIGTAAMMGLALAEAWQSKRYLRLGLTYFSVMLVHGLWNTLSVLNGLSNFLAAGDGLVRFLYRVGEAAPYGLTAISVGIFSTLVLVNFRLRKETAGLENAQNTPAPAGGSDLEILS